MMRDLLSADLANTPLSAVLVAVFFFLFLGISLRLYMRSQRTEIDRGANLPLDD